MDRALTAILGFVAAGVTVLAVAAVILTVRTDADDRHVGNGAAVGTFQSVEESGRDGSSFPSVEHDAAAARGLTEAWARWRTATYVAQGTWTRTVDSIAEPLTGEVYVVQDPPRRLVIRLGSVVERQGDQVSACSPTVDEETDPLCVAGDGLSYDQLLEHELALVFSYVNGATRIYDVAAVEGCFQAELTASALASPWGQWAEYCFDDETGALRSARIRRPSAVDVELIDAIRSEVTDADFG